MGQVHAPAGAQARHLFQDPENIECADQSYLSSSGGDVSFNQNTLPSHSSHSLSLWKTNDVAKAINKYQFSRPHRGETEKLVIRSYVNVLLPLCALILIICVTV